MKNNKLVLATMASIALSSTSAFAQPQTYLTFDASTLKFQEEADNLKASATPYTLGAGIGAELFEHFSVEGMLKAGVNDADVKISGVSGVSGDLRLDYMTGIYGLVRSYENRTGSAYLKAGFTKVKGSGKVSNGGLSENVDFDDTSFSYGIGVDFTYSEESSIRIEYMNFFDQDDINIDGFSLSFKTDLPL